VAPALIVWCALGLAGWWALLRRTPHGLGGQVFPTEWRAGEAMLAAVLGAYFLLSILSGGGASAPITPDAVTSGITLYAVLLAFLLGFLAMRKLSPVRVFGLAPAHWPRVLALGLFGFAATYPAVLVVEQLTSALGPSASDSDEMVQYLSGPLSPTHKAAAIALAVLVAPLTEEFIFRGFFYGVLKRHFGQLAAMAASAAFFAAVHQNIPALPALFVLAVGFTLAYELTGSLWAPVLMHALFNGVSVVVILFFPEWIPNT
jgi:membrane protease YdiL (CAAX protease family)